MEVPTPKLYTVLLIRRILLPPVSKLIPKCLFVERLRLANMLLEILILVTSPTFLKAPSVPPPVITIFEKERLTPIPPVFAILTPEKASCLRLIFIWLKLELDRFSSPIIPEVKFTKVKLKTVMFLIVALLSI